MAANSFRCLHLKLFKDVLKNEILGSILGEGQPCWGTTGGTTAKNEPSICESWIHRLSTSFQLLEKIASLRALAAGSLKRKTEASMLFFQTISHKCHHFSSHITMPV